MDLLRPRYYPLIDVELIYFGDKVVISDRNRFAYLIRDRNFNVLIYRNRLRFTFFPNKKVSPYIDDEIFIVERRGFNQNRISTGLLFPVTDNFIPRIFYLLRQDKQLDNSWKSINVLGIHLYFLF